MERFTQKKAEDERMKITTTTGLMLGMVTLACMWQHVPAANLGQDFLFSNASISESRPDIGVDIHGNAVVVWFQWETGEGGNLVMYRRFSADGIALCDPTRVTEAGTGNPIQDLQVAVADSGFFAVMWSIQGGAATGLYLRRYNTNGTAFDASPIVVSSRIFDRSAACAINNLGECGVVYDDSTGTIGTTGKIYVSSATNPLQLPKGMTYDYFPYIGLSDNSHLAYVIGTTGDGVWQRSGTYGSSIAWNDSGSYPASAYRISPWTLGVDMQHNGAYCIVWLNNTSSRTIVQGKWYTANGGNNGSVFTIVDSARVSGNDETIDIDIGASGAMVVKWYFSASGTQPEGPYMRLYSATGSALTGVIPLFTRAMAEHSSNSGSSIALNAANEPIAVINAMGTVSQGLPLLQYYTSSGAAKGPEFAINMGSKALSPAAAAALKGDRWATVWEEFGNNGRIMLQNFFSNRVIYRARALQMNAAGTGRNPAIALWSDSAMVVWEDCREGETTPSMWVQLSHNIDLIGQNRRISDIGAACTNPSLAVSQSRVFAVWEDARSANGDTAHVYGQLLTKAGLGSGGNIQISAATGGGFSPTVVSNGKDAFAVVWSMTSSGPGPISLLVSDVYGRRFDGSGSAVGDTFRINPSAGAGWNPTAAMDSAGNLAAAWTTSKGQVYCRVLNPAGAEKVAAFRVDTGSRLKSDIVIAMTDQGAFMVAWRATYSGNSAPAIESRVFNSNGTAQGGVRQNNDLGLRIDDPQLCAIGDSNSAHLAWIDSRCADTTKKDVWGENLSITNDVTSAGDAHPEGNRITGINKEQSRRAVRCFSLSGREIGVMSANAGLRPSGVFVVKEGNRLYRRVEVRHVNRAFNSSSVSALPEKRPCR